MIVRPGNSQFGLMLATTFSIAIFATSIFSTDARAYTQEEEQACTPDAMRLCGAYIPDVDRITACMIQLRDQLSPECKVYFRGARPQATPVVTGDPMSIAPRKKTKASAVKSSTAKTSTAKASKPKKSQKNG